MGVRPIFGMIIPWWLLVENTIVGSSLKLQQKLLIFIQTSLVFMLQSFGKYIWKFNYIIHLSRNGVNF